MGNKEISVGCFSFNNVINLRRYPTVDVVRVVFLLYHMNNTKTIKHTPISMIKLKLIWGTKKMDSFHQLSKGFVTNVHRHGWQFHYLCCYCSTFFFIESSKICFILDHNVGDICIFSDYNLKRTGI